MLQYLRGPAIKNYVRYSSKSPAREIEMGVAPALVALIHQIVVLGMANVEGLSGIISTSEGVVDLHKVGCWTSKQIHVSTDTAGCTVVILHGVLYYIAQPNYKVSERDVKYEGGVNERRTFEETSADVNKVKDLNISKLVTHFSLGLAADTVSKHVGGELINCPTEENELKLLGEASVGTETNKTEVHSESLSVDLNLISEQSRLQLGGSEFGSALQVLNVSLMLANVPRFSRSVDYSGLSVCR